MSPLCSHGLLGRERKGRKEARGYSCTKRETSEVGQENFVITTVMRF